MGLNVETITFYSTIGFFLVLNKLFYVKMCPNLMVKYANLEWLVMKFFSALTEWLISSVIYNKVTKKWVLM